MSKFLNGLAAAGLGILGFAAIILIAALPTLCITLIVWYLAPVVLGAALPITFLRLFLGVWLLALVFRFLRGGNQTTTSSKQKGE